MGYTHSFCTPHIWPSLPGNSIELITQWTEQLQKELDRAGIPLKLLPGGEVGLRMDLDSTLPATHLATYGMRNKHVLIDLWADRLPEFFEPQVRKLQAKGLTVILAHPERMRAIQDEPEVIEEIQRMGVLLQGNLQCLSDPPGTATNETVERFLAENRYFMLGSDLHNLKSLPQRMNGLTRAIELVGEAKVNELTIDHPRQLLPTDT